MIILDGGMGNELLKRTNIPSAGLWSAQFLLDSPNLVEWDYFPDTGFGATVSPALASDKSEFSAGFTFPAELLIGKTYSVKLSFNSEERLLKYSQKLFPIYFLITAVIFILMISTGNRAFTSLCLAFSTISTSGILPNNTENFLEVAILSQLIIVIFLTISLSHTFSTLENLSVFKRLKSEREFRVGVILVFITFLLFTLIDGYNFVGINNSTTLNEFFYKMWIRLFSLFSFITTTGVYA